jgi:hypothetical protein
MDSQLKVLFELTRVINDEPRIRDLDLATGLGYKDVHEIRGLIQTLLSDLAKLGQVSVVATETSGPSGGRPSKTYWLNEPQAYLVCANTRTPRAAEFRLLLVKVFMMYKRGFAVPKQQSLVTTVIDAQIELFEATVMRAETRLASRFDELQVGLNRIAQTTQETKRIVLSTQNDVIEVKKTQAFRRVEVSSETLELHIKCLHERRHGICPCCESTRILDEHGAKLSEFVIDHWYSRKKNKPAETWPVCSDCNQKLESSEFRKAHQDQFGAYQSILAKIMEGPERPLFIGTPLFRKEL